jgi:hypothetical protein
MKPDQIKKYNKAAMDGNIPDDENPVFLFQDTATRLLVMGINREFNFTLLARQELENRGLNLKGEWVGFNKNISKRKPTRKKGKRL